MTVTTEAAASTESGTPHRTERIAVRVTAEVDELLRDAAAIEHKSLSAFILDAAAEQARRTLDEHHRLLVPAATFQRLLDELDRPGEVVEPLRAAIQRVQARREA